jgi:hypothetical protein
MRAVFLLPSLILLLCLAASPDARAQRERPAPDPEALAEAEMTWLSEGLTLSEAQVDRIRPLLLDFADQTARIMQSAHAGEWTEMRAALQKINEEKASALRPFLTGEQYARYLLLRDQLEEARRQQRRR